jgi:hypothetical protein
MISDADIPVISVPATTDHSAPALPRRRPPGAAVSNLRRWQEATTLSARLAALGLAAPGSDMSGVGARLTTDPLSKEQ